MKCANPHQSASLNLRITFFSALAVVLHAMLLHHWIDTPFGQDLRLSHLGSLVLWLMTLCILLFSMLKPLRQLLVLMMPLTALSILVVLWLPTKPLIKAHLSPMLLGHVLVSILCFGFLSLAALQAGLLYLQSRLLRKRLSPLYSGFMRLWPPLQTMEALLFQVMGLGFIGLSASLGSALFCLHPMASTHPYKMLLSVCTWIVFAFLLYTHQHFGMGGLKTIQWTLVGLVLLTSAFLAGRLTLMNI